MAPSELNKRQLLWPWLFTGFCKNHKKARTTCFLLSVQGCRFFSAEFEISLKKHSHTCCSNSIPCIYLFIVPVLNWTQNNYVESCKAEWLQQRCKFNPEMKRGDLFQSLPVGMFQYQVHHRRPGTFNIYWVYYTFLLHKNGTALHLQTSCFHERSPSERCVILLCEFWWPKWVFSFLNLGVKRTPEKEKKTLQGTLLRYGEHPKYTWKVHPLKWINCKINALRFSANLCWLGQLPFAQAIKIICNKGKRRSHLSRLHGQALLSIH